MLNGGYFVVELVGGLRFGSLALVADAAHMAFDVGALLIALVALGLAARPATDRHTYGLARAEVLGALINGFVLIGAALWIGVEALRRVGDQPEMRGGGVVAIAAIGLAINLASALVLWRSAGRSHNMRGALWHMVSDALGSVAALAAGLAYLAFGVLWVDLAASLVVVVLVAVGAWKLLSSTLAVLLESTPAHLDRGAVTEAMLGVPDVAQVHHVHLWSIGSETEALSAHVVIDGEPSLHDAQRVADQVKQVVGERFGIAHATIEVECHPCDAPHADPAPPGTHDASPGGVPA